MFRIFFVFTLVLFPVDANSSMPVKLDTFIASCKENQSELKVQDRSCGAYLFGYLDAFKLTAPNINLNCISTYTPDKLVSDLDKELHLNARLGKQFYHHGIYSYLIKTCGGSPNIYEPSTSQ
jgi:hypothetical protein